MQVLYQQVEDYHRSSPQEEQPVAFLFPDISALQGYLKFSQQQRSINETLLPKWAEELHTMSSLLTVVTGGYTPSLDQQLNILYNNHQLLTKEKLSWAAFFPIGQHLLQLFEQLHHHTKNPLLLWKEQPRTDWPFTQESHISRWHTLHKILPSLCTAFRKTMKEHGWNTPTMLMQEWINKASLHKKATLPWKQLYLVGHHPTSYLEEQYLLTLSQQLSMQCWNASSPHTMSKLPIKSTTAPYFPTSIAKTERITLPTLVEQWPLLFNRLHCWVASLSALTTKNNKIAILLPQNLFLSLLARWPAILPLPAYHQGIALKEHPWYTLLQSLLQLYHAESQKAWLDREHALERAAIHPLLQSWSTESYLLRERVKKGATISTAVNKQEGIWQNLWAIFNGPISKFWQRLSTLSATIYSNTPPSPLAESSYRYWQRFIEENKEQPPPNHYNDTAWWHFLSRKAAALKITYTPPSDTPIHLFSWKKLPHHGYTYLMGLSCSSSHFPTSSASYPLLQHLAWWENRGLPTTTTTLQLQTNQFYQLLGAAKEALLLHYQEEADGSIVVPPFFWQQLLQKYPDQTISKYPKSLLSNPAIATSPMPALPATPTSLVRYHSFFSTTSLLGSEQKALSPSALNLYLTCPLQFYLRYLLNYPAKEPSDKEALMTRSLLGTWLHGVMEALYRPYVKQTISLPLIEQLQKQITQQVITFLNKQIIPYHKQKPLPNRYKVWAVVVDKMVQRVLLADKCYAPFDLLAVERNHMAAFPLPNGRKIALKGIIDRIDRKEDCIRLVDYKTGKVPTHLPTVSHWFALSERGNHAIAIQLALYGFLYQQSPLTSPSYRIQPTLLSAQKSQRTKHLDGALWIESELTGEYNLWKDYNTIAPQFHKEIAVIIEEIGISDRSFAHPIDRPTSYCTH